MGSTRLPGKSLMPLAGEPLIARVLERLRGCRMVDELVLAIPEGDADSPLADLGKRMGVEVFRGSEDDLVDRHYQAAKALGAEFVVRVPGDNPTPEPWVIDLTIRHHLASGNDFTSTYPEHIHNGFPSGVGCEVYLFGALERVWQEASDPRHREHAHTYVYEHPELFRIGAIQCPVEFRRPEVALDVNTEEQYRMFSSLFDDLYARNPRFGLGEILRWYDEVYRRSVRV